jgi:UDP-3-O-[3-hydroxymyristoyl] N-acetylglucosamine deacetylase
MQFQTTIQNPVSCYGIGVHSGKRTQLTLKPAKAGTGVVFIRTDITSLSNDIAASYINVSETMLSTTISNDAHSKVSTIEHLMAALSGCNVHNVIVELDGEEVPIMDGSSRPFVFMLECAGTKVLDVPVPHLQILREVAVSHNDAYAMLEPSDHFSINMTIDFDNKVIGKQERVFCSADSFKDSLSSARTFGFLHELEYLKSKGLAKGASLENAVGIEDDKILNEDGLRFEDEFVRHKLLDAVGDFYTAGNLIIGSFSCYKTGHALNNQLLRKLFSDPQNYKLITA